MFIPSKTAAQASAFVPFICNYLWAALHRNGSQGVCNFWGKAKWNLWNCNASIELLYCKLLFGSVLLLLLSIQPALSPPSTTFAEQHKHSSAAPNKHAKPHVVHRFRSGLFALSNCNTFSLSFDDKTSRPNKFQHISYTPTVDIFQTFLLFVFRCAYGRANLH